LAPQIRHAEGFVSVARPLFEASPRLVDMGAGGGLPGLVVARGWPDLTLVLLEANERRATFLRHALGRLQLEGRVSVLQQRAEISGRSVELRGSFDGAIARSFGRPAVLAECTAPLLRVGGWLVVSEPPATSESAGAVNTREEHRPGAALAEGDDMRWPAEPLRQLGMEAGALVHLTFDYQCLRQVEMCPEHFPRRNGVPTKRPLF
jgi:16S rRNA (guanine527-N7)-methyltransferase